MDVICIICTHKFGPNESISMTPCEHVFHKNCISKWILTSSTCPKCRADARIIDLKNVYFDFCENEELKQLKQLLEQFQTNCEKINQLNNRLRLLEIETANRENNEKMKVVYPFSPIVNRLRSRKN